MSECWKCGRPTPAGVVECERCEQQFVSGDLHQTVPPPLAESRRARMLTIDWSLIKTEADVLDFIETLGRLVQLMTPRDGATLSRWELIRLFLTTTMQLQVEEGCQAYDILKKYLRKTRGHE